MLYIMHRQLTRLLLLVILCMCCLFPIAQPTDLPPAVLITGKQGLPQGFVAGMAQDKQGFIWLATRDGLCRYDGNGFKVFRPAADGQPSFSNIRTLKKDDRGRLWLTSERADIAFFDPQTEHFTNLSTQIFGQRPLDTLVIQQVFPDRQNRLWIALYGEGLICFDLRTRQSQWFHHQPDQPNALASNYVASIGQDLSGTIWLATSAGLDHFDEQTKNFKHDNPVSHKSLALPEANLSSLYLQANGEFLIGSPKYITRFNPRSGMTQAYRLPADGDEQWGMRFATDSRGGVYFDQRDRLFSFSAESGPKLLTRLTSQTGFSSSLLIDHSDVLWMGTDGSGIRKYDLHANGFQALPYQVNFHTDLLTNWLGLPVSEISPYVQRNDPYQFRYTRDSQGAMWLNVGSSTFYRINSASHQVRRILFPVSFVQTINPLATDRQGRVWVLNNWVLWWYDDLKKNWVRSGYSIQWLITNDIWQMTVDDQAFWFATSSRGLFRLDRKTGQLRQFANQPGQPASLSNNALFCLSADPDDTNRLWIGTFGSGLCAFDKRTGKCRRITEQDGLPNNVIYSALPDRQGYLWIGTNKGLCRMNRKTFQIQVYTIEDGLLANEFNRFHYLQLPNGQILMGGVEGITAFQPAQFREDDFEPKVELTELQVNNRLIEPEMNALLSKPIQTDNELTLPYNQNFITATFAALQFNRPGKNKYRYQLKGIDSGWVESYRPQAVYTALPPGHYTLLLNASNTSGRWSRYVRELAIVITPPWWRTWWAYLLYGSVVAGLSWYGLQLYLNRLHMQQEAKQLKKLDELKSRFFTNITHDFRTPLTLILSPVDVLLQNLAGTSNQKHLELIQRNAKQLLSLINQVLDFSKLDAQMLGVNESRGDLAEFIGQIVQLFREDGLLKNIEISYESKITGKYWFDAGKLERIVSNLIANALKFTPSGGKVSISVQASDPIFLTVSDTGIGILPEKLPAIFNRFFQIDEENTIHSSQGSGIGLALVKELVELQNGQIEVESTLGKGTTFNIKLPYKSATEPLNASVHSLLPLTAGTTDSAEDSTEERPLLLLVEDHLEMADFISESLAQQYRIVRAQNGADGLQQAFSEIPDLVISDVMMPVMDGYAFCQELKKDERTSHIPVILLTAKTALDSRLQGLSQGADDYLTKPFYVQELMLRLHNMLERQRRYRERMQRELVQPDQSPDSPVQAEPADPFLQRVYQIIEEKLDDTLFSVEQLADNMNLSRSQLYRKVKALTGLPVSDVIRNYRLKRATYYLKNGLNSSETAYQVGFDSPPYFAKCFREVYQMSPGEFARNN